MKKILATALVLSVVFATRAQEIPERKHDGYKPHGEKGMHHRRPGGMDFKQLNLTDAQKEQMKTQRESFRKQMDELKKNDNITVKEWKTRMENLRKEQKSGMEKILTADQKKQLEKMKSDQHSKMEDRRKQGAERMKQHLGLTAEQSSKLEQSRKETGDKIKAIRENKSLSDEKKREQMKEVMKKQKEQLKSVLTEEQLQKMKEQRHHGPHKGGKKPDMSKETI
jgi:Spy/CpxP family protein refolding chaperone